MTTGSEPADAPAFGLPRVAIVGRPNVGKSTLLNRLCGSRVAIVEPTAGVTRDRIAVPARLDTEDGPRWIEVIDTGGIGIVDRDDLGPHVEAQVNTAVAASELVLFVVDVRDGLTPLDIEVAQKLRGSKLPVLLVVNKCEGRALEWDVDQFLRLGVGDEHFGVSAQNGEGLDALSEAIAARLPRAPSERPTEVKPVLKIAVIGRRNAGKSTLVNRLAGEERMIVSEIPGTTRDAVDVVFERHGERFIVIDTAGIRKQTKIEDAIEFYSDARAKKSVRRADAVILLFDVTEPLSAIEKSLARFAIDRHKPLILGANKWDLVDPNLEPEKFREYLDAEMPGITFAPIVFLSAKDGERTEALINVARDLAEQGRRRVTTGELNKVLERALSARQPSSKGYRLKLRYATQVDVSPPTFVLFVNDKRHVGKDWLRYLTNRIRAELPFPEVPLRILVKDKHSAEDEDQRDD